MSDEEKKEEERMDEEKEKEAADRKKEAQEKKRWPWRRREKRTKLSLKWCCHIESVIVLPY